MPFTVTNFGTNRKPVCDFLFVSSTKIHLPHTVFQVIADDWSNFCCWQLGICLRHTRSLVNLWTQDYENWPYETRHIALYVVPNAQWYLELFRHGSTSV